MEALPIPEAWETSGPESLEQLGRWDVEVYQPWMRDWLASVDPARMVGVHGHSSDPWIVATTAQGYRGHDIDDADLLPDILAVPGSGVAYDRPWSALSELTGRGAAHLADQLDHGQYGQMEVSIFPGSLLDPSEPYHGIDGEGYPQYVTPWNIDIWIRYASLRFDDERRRLSTRLDDALQDRDDRLGIDWGIPSGLGRLAADITSVFRGLPSMAVGVITGDIIGGIAGGVSDMYAGQAADILEGIGGGLSGVAETDQAAYADVDAPAAEPTDGLAELRRLWNRASVWVRWYVYAHWYRQQHGRWPTVAPAFIYYEL